MTGLPDPLDLLCCPICRGSVRSEASGLQCQTGGHTFERRDRYVLFAPTLDVGKYNLAYAERYAFLWSYGYETRHSGLVESLYRSVSALLSEALAARGSATPVVVDCGCGVGRVTCDAARLVPDARVVSFDASCHMLDLASQIVLGQSAVEATLADIGFETPLSIHGRHARNVFMAQADARALPLSPAIADVVLSVNIIDRLPDGPEALFREARRVLRDGGTFILTNPLNWQDARWWREFGTAASVLALLRRCGFVVDTWFDQLLYRETLDARGSVEEFTTLVVAAVAS